MMKQIPPRRARIMLRLTGLLLAIMILSLAHAAVAAGQGGGKGQGALNARTSGGEDSGEEAGEFKTRRIRFPRGSTTAVVRDSIGPEGEHVYFLRARVGQTLTVRLRSRGSKVRFLILTDEGGLITTKPGSEDPDMSAAWRGQLPSGSDYQITVYPDSDGNRLAYTLEVTAR